MLAQLILNAIVSGSAFAAIGLSFSIIYAPAKFLHFAHGVVYTGAGYATFTALVLWNWPLYLAVVAGVAVATMLGCACEFFLYRPLRRRRASSLASMLASLGLYVVLQNVLSLSYGDEAKSLRVGEAAVGIPIAGARLATSQAALAVGSTCAIVIVWLILKYTRFGKAIRAVSSDSELAAVRGIDVSRTILGAFALGSGLVGLVGILMGLDVDLVPTMGLNALMMGVVAMIVGGARSTIGICIGGLMLGLAQNLGVWKIGSGWQDSIAFLIMVVFVLLRPQGVIGRLPQKSNV